MHETTNYEQSLKQCCRIRCTVYYLISFSVGQLVIVHPLQDLLGCSPLSFLQCGGGSGSRQDHNQSFEGCGYSRDTHLIGKVEESISPSVAVVHVIERLANPSRLTHLMQEHHRG